MTNKKQDPRTKGFVLDGVAASNLIDSSGEILDVASCDISDLVEGRGNFNYEHKNQTSSNGEEIVGKIVYAKKILKRTDCENDRQREYWDEVRAPYLYVIGRLYDAAGNEGAKALAAQMRDAAANNEPLILGMSVEGSTLRRSGQTLYDTVVRRVALTLRPCNKSAIVGIIEDPQAPAGFKKDHTPDALAVVAKAEDPLYRTLHKTEFTYRPFPESEHLDLIRSILRQKLAKTLTAGTYDAAPSSLTGGAALAKEHVDVKTQVLGIIKGLDKSKRKSRDEIKAVFKAALPDVSDEFLEHFTDLADDYQGKVPGLRKDEGEALKPKAKRQPKPKLAPEPEPVEDVEPDSTEAPLTIRGKPVQPSNVAQAHFDEDTGILHTPRGQFPMYIPDHDSSKHKDMFWNILNDPKVHDFHDRAMQNWVKVHALAKEGKVPGPVVMHATLFSQLSPNTPTQIQELMYSSLVDTMSEAGIDATSPEFAKLKQNWVDRDQPQTLPKHSRSYFENMPGIRIKTGLSTTGRQKGDISSFMLANNKFANMAQYHTLHQSLVDLLSRHKADARSAAAELMQHKHKAGLWNAKRARYLKEGKLDPGPYTEGPDVPGLAPKTARYTLGMLGLGNSVVADTHFTRYLFGLEKTKDTGSINYLKQTLWNPKSNVLDGIDRYYFKHHDAVKHLLTHPRYKHVFADDPEQSIFPAFWRNWISIVPHEKARGMKTGGLNEETDHRPYWEAIDPFLTKAMPAEGLSISDLTKSEHADTETAYATAKLHRQWQMQHGDMNAFMLYCRYLLPKLMPESDSVSTLVKAQNMLLELRKSNSESKVLDRVRDGVNGAADEPEQQQLLQGLDLADHDPYKAGWVKSHHGPVYVKTDWATKSWNGPVKEAAFFSVGKSWGLQRMLQPAAAFHYPGQDMTGAAILGCDGDVFDEKNPDHVQAQAQARAKGDLDKLLILDTVMGNNDRHHGNILITKSGQLKAIDHSELDGIDLMQKPWREPVYMVGGDHDWRMSKPHPDTESWISSLDPVKLKNTLLSAGAQSEFIGEAMRRLRAVQDHVKTHPQQTRLGSLWMAPFQDWE